MDNHRGLWISPWEIACIPWESPHHRREFSTQSTDFPTKQAGISVFNSFYFLIFLLKGVGKGDFAHRRRAPFIHRSHRFRQAKMAVENVKFCIISAFSVKSARFRAPVKRWLWKRAVKYPFCRRFSKHPPVARPTIFLPFWLQFHTTVPTFACDYRKYSVISERNSTFPPFCRPYDGFDYELT